MKFRYLILVSIILAILTISAVSANDDLSENLTAKNDVELDETPVDEIIASSDDSVVISDEVIASSDDGDVVCDEDDVSLYINEDDIKRGNENYDVITIENEGYSDITGRLVVKTNEKTYYNKTVTVDGYDYFYLNALDFKNLPIGNYRLYASFISEDLKDPLETSTLINVVSNIDYSSNNIKITIYDGEIKRGNSAYKVVKVSNNASVDINGRLVVKTKDKTFFNSTITLDSEDTYILTALDLKTLPIGNYKLYATFTAEDLETPIEQSSNVNVVYDTSYDSDGVYLRVCDGEIRRGNIDYEVVRITNNADFDITGELIVKTENKNYYKKTITVKSKSSHILNALDLKELPLGTYYIEVSFTSNSLQNPLVVATTIPIVYDMIFYLKQGDEWNPIYNYDELYGYCDEDIEMKVEVPSTVSGLISYTLLDLSNTAKINDGVAYLTIKTSKLDLQEYPLEVRCIATNNENRTRDMELTIEPHVKYLPSVPVDKPYEIGIILPPKYSGSFRIYNYDPVTGVIGSMINTGNVVNGTCTLTMEKLTVKNTYYYHVFFESGNYNYPENIAIRAIENNPYVSAKVDKTTVEVGNPVTASATGPYGTYILYVDGNYKKSYNNVQSFNEAISDLSIGTHKINIFYANEVIEYSNLFTVTVKAKEIPSQSTPNQLGKTVTKLTLKKVKTVKKSAKKLVLQATSKQNNKAVKGAKVIFKFKGKKYTAKTNSKGIAKVTIKKSVLKKLKPGKKIKYIVTSGNAVEKRTIKVKK